MPNENHCGNCMYWVKGSSDRQGDVGQCRRYPPRSYDYSGNLDYPVVVPSWVRTHSDDWCGEHRPPGSG